MIQRRLGEEGRGSRAYLQIFAQEAKARKVVQDCDIRLPPTHDIRLRRDSQLLLQIQVASNAG